jgi:dihydromethanopterin reductase (acceptor)
VEIQYSFVPFSIGHSAKTIRGSGMKEKRIAWAITGAGHALEECVNALLKYERMDLFLSRAAEEVLRMYDLYSCIQASRIGLYREDAASAPAAARFFAGVYSVYAVAPATSNSVAKFVHGISDTLVTNMFAQAGKARIPIIVYPTDLEPEVESFGPRRERIMVYPRPVDLENADRLKEFIGTKIVRSREELERCLAAYL